MHRFLGIGSGLLTFMLVLPFMTGCGSDDGGSVGGTEIRGTGDPITISGIVLDDNLAGAEGACVFLLDNEDLISAPANASGEYEITIPAGSQAFLVADDCDAPMSREGKYFPAINVSGVTGPTHFEEDTEGWPMHLSENASENTVGALAAYENYFENATVAAGFYAPVTSVYDDYNGFIFMSTYWVDTQDPTFFENVNDQTVTIDDENCPVGYISYADYVDPDTGAISLDSPNILQEDGGTGTDFAAAILSFCGPDSKNEVTFTLNSPYHHITQYVMSLPVRPDSCTLLFPASIDGEDVPFKDVLTLFGAI